MANPFQTLFSPSRGGVTGAVGMALGLPSDSQRRGQAQHAGLATLQQSVQQAGDPQRGLMQWLSTPEGMDYFTQGGDLNQITQYMQMAHPPAPETQYFQNSPGQELLAVTPDGQASALHRTPTTEEQTFAGLAGISMLPQEDLAMIAAAQLEDNANGNTVAAERAARALLRMGKIDEEQAALFGGGAFQIAERWNGDQYVINMITGEEINLGVPGRDGAPETGLPEPAAERAPGLYIEGIEDPSEIVYGVGTTASMLVRLGQIGGEFDPNLAATRHRQYQQGIEQIRHRLRGLRHDGRLARDADTVEAILDTQRSSTPAQMVNNLIGIHDVLDRAEADAVSTMAANSGASRAQRLEAESELRAYQALRMDMPTREQLRERLRIVMTEPGPAVTAIQQAPAVLGEALDRIFGSGSVPAIPGQPATPADPAAPPLPAPGAAPAAPTAQQSGQSGAPPTFATEDAARAAISAGQLQPGDTFYLNGQLRVYQNAQ